jgi:hypothetical protein
VSAVVDSTIDLRVPGYLAGLRIRAGQRRSRRGPYGAGRPICTTSGRSFARFRPPVTQAATLLPALATLVAEAGGHYIHIGCEQTTRDTNFAAADETVKWRLTRLSSCAGFQRPFRRDMEANKMSFIVLLVLTIVMPPNTPDIRHQMQEPSIEQCWADAAEFVQHGVPKVVTNGQAVMAGCLVREAPSNDS